MMLIEVEGAADQRFSRRTKQQHVQLQWRIPCGVDVGAMSAGARSTRFEDIHPNSSSRGSTGSVIFMTITKSVSEQWRSQPAPSALWPGWVLVCSLIPLVGPVTCGVVEQKHGAIVLPERVALGLTCNPFHTVAFGPEPLPFLRSVF
jgi:hypothetical protein